jgi:hypothetical protein
MSSNDLKPTTSSETKKKNKKKNNKKKGPKYQPKLIDGQINPKYVDLLDEDQPISGQKFGCFSFISPEKILKQKELFLFEQFLKQYGINKSMSKFIEFTHFISYKYNLDFNVLSDDFKSFVEAEKEKVYKDELYDDYKTYLDQNEERLEAKFNKEHDFQTSTRGVKFRGAFPTLEEAELRSKTVRKTDPNHDIFVGPVGIWIPWHPDAYKTLRTEYMEDELNHLQHEKNNNERYQREMFEQRVFDSKKNAMEQNQKAAEKHGFKLTQTMDENGNLVGIKETNTQEQVFSNQKEVTQQEIIDELFEGEDIVMVKRSDNGFSRLPEETKQKLLPKSLED